MSNKSEAERELLYGYYHKWTLCETLRRIYDLIENIEDKELKNKIFKLLVQSIGMSRKMSNRLIYYKTKYEDTTGHNSSNLRNVDDFDEVMAKRIARWENDQEGVPVTTEG